MAAVSNKFRDLLQVSVSPNYCCLPTLAAGVFRENSGKNHFSLRLGHVWLQECWVGCRREHISQLSGMETAPARLHSHTSWQLHIKHWKQLQSQKECCFICLHFSWTCSWFSIFRKRNINSISISSVLPRGTAHCQVVHSLTK